ncbi:MAG: DUF2130 domain-containing protein [Candidatus Levyibacteriota bacterium]|jgi:hypothetical protein
MKTVKVSVQDENTLVLDEDASKGDLIDLKSVNKTDNSTIKNVINSIKKDRFDEELQRARESDRLKMELKEQENVQRSKDELSKKDSEIATLKSQIDKNETEKKLAVSEAVNDLKVELTKKEGEKSEIRIEYDLKLKDRDEQIERLKDNKIKLSTKGLGESLEQYCENEFNKIRMTAFPNVYFEKDNDSSSGSKGDYIFRDPAEGIESVSIMFDMKNENDTTETKKKNEDFLAKLDRDRNEKKCEYAILVSMLEAESDLYNQGIVDISYKYPKMYVIRPQFFIPMITLLKNAAEKSFAVKNELAIIRSQNIDITTFEDDVNNWKSGFLNSMKNAGQKHSEAIEQINKAIKNLENVRDALTLSDKHLLAAENKMDDLTIKRLTRKNPTMAAKFDELKKK